ncbi:MAG: hypothetical protein IPO86_12270 [Saprospiraceae bacterium]|nr:hypothetical protein [Saprospiraceae bacterium]
MNNFINQALILIFLILWSAIQSQIATPNLPNTSSISSCFPDTTGYLRFTVGPTGRDFKDLQLAINTAQPGTVLILDAGARFNGGFTLPAKSNAPGWIILISSRMDLLPKEEIRVAPFASTGNMTFKTQASVMPKIVTSNLSGIPCLVTQTNAHHYRIVGIEITADPSVLNSYGLINFGDGSSAQNSLTNIPHHLIVDRCYIHGHTKATIMKYGVRLDCANAAILDSYISDFHSIGFDAQAISGINGPGPFKIINNYLEASGENILFGGAATAIPGLIPSDIEIRQNYFYKPWSWKVGHPSYAGTHWTIKNLFELKTGVRVLLDGNILENSWADLPIGQSGAAILLTIRIEGGSSPQADVSDVTITNNIIRHAGSGISLSGSDGGLGTISKRIKIANNLFEDINGPAFGDQNIAGPNDGIFIKIGEPMDIILDHNTIFQTGAITWAYDIAKNFTFTNNICNSYVSAGGYQGIYGPGYSQGNNTIAHYFPDITDSNKRFHKNVLIGGDASKYSNFKMMSQNYFPANVSNVGFTDYPNGILDYKNYKLKSNSLYFKNGTDQLDLGVDFNKLDSAFFQSRNCPPITTYTTEKANPEFIKIEHFVSNDNISFKIQGMKAKYILLTDLTGKRVLHNNMNSNAFELKTNSFLPGLYIVTFASDLKSISKLISIHP